MRRRRGISFGTIAMILIACITVASTFGVILAIREDEGDFTIDAETLLGSVAELIAVSQRHISDGIDEDVKPMDTVIASTPNVVAVSLFLPTSAQPPTSFLSVPAALATSMELRSPVCVNSMLYDSAPGFEL